MKSTTLLISIVFMALSSLAAADSGDARAQRLADQLDLDEAQTEAVDELISKHRHGMREQMASHDSRGSQRREQMRASRKALHADIRELLTPEQAEKFDRLIAQRRSMMSERRGRREHMRGERHSGRRGMMHNRDRGMAPCGSRGFEPDFSKLDVSEGVRARLEAMHKEHRAEMTRMHQRHRDEMRELIGDEELEKLDMPGGPERSADDAGNQADNQADNGNEKQG